MTFEEDFRALMPDTISIKLVTSRDAYDKRTYGTAISYQALVQEGQHRVVTADGRETLSTHTIWVAPHATSGLPVLTPDAQVTLADGSTHGILRHEQKHDELGNHHVVIWLGR